MQKKARGDYKAAFGESKRWGGPWVLPNVFQKQALEPRAEY